MSARKLRVECERRIEIKNQNNKISAGIGSGFGEINDGSKNRKNNGRSRKEQINIHERDVNDEKSI